MNVVLRVPPREPFLETSLRGGSFGHREAWAAGGGPLGPVRVLASGSATRGDGFRSDAGFEERAGRVALAATLGRVEASLSVSALDGRWRQPGKVSAADLAADPFGSSLNALDRAASRQDLASLRLERKGTRGTDWTLVASRRERGGELLTTGLSDYGFLTEDDTVSLAATIEGVTAIPGTKLSLRWGAEASRDRLHPRGLATDSVRDGRIDALDLVSDARVRWRKAAVFAGLETVLPRGVVLDAGVRHYLSDVRRAGTEVLSSGLMGDVSGRRSFGDTTLGLGVSRRHDVGKGSIGWSASWSQAFLPPSAVELFAFPGYSSNVDLVPQRSSGIVLGLRARTPRVELDAQLFETGVDDEIVYDAGARKNLNATRTRRRGGQARLSLLLHDKARVTVEHVASEATFRRAWRSPGGPVAAGARVPLVGDRTALTVDLGPWRGARVGLSARSAGRLVLADDFDNSAPLLPRRTVVSLTASRDLRLRRGELRLAAHVDNLFDRVQPAWGIEAAGDRYFTVAPPRAVTLSVGYDF